MGFGGIFFGVYMTDLLARYPLGLLESWDEALRYTQSMRQGGEHMLFGNFGCFGSAQFSDMMIWDNEGLRKWSWSSTVLKKSPGLRRCAGAASGHLDSSQTNRNHHNIKEISEYLQSDFLLFWSGSLFTSRDARYICHRLSAP